MYALQRIVPKLIENGRVDAQRFDVFEDDRLLVFVTGYLAYGDVADCVRTAVNEDVLPVRIAWLGYREVPLQLAFVARYKARTRSDCVMIPTRRFSSLMIGM